MGLIIEGKTPGGVPTLTIALTFEEVASLMAGDGMIVQPETHQTVAAGVQIGLVVAPSNDVLLEIVDRVIVQTLSEECGTPVVLAPPPKGAQ